MRESVRISAGLIGAVAIACAALVGLAASARPTPAGGPQVQSAKDLYLDKCAVCHGEDGRGKTAKGRKVKAKDIHDTIKTISEAEMVLIVHDGKDPDMDAWGKQLSDDQIRGLVAYYRGLAK